MKTKTLLSLLLIAVSSLSFAQSEYNLESSKIQWKGTKITNQSHTGTLKFKEAEIKIKNKTEVSGQFKVDMKTITNDDLSGEWKQKLEGHLKSDDFFSVDKHPEANLIIKKVNSQKLKLPSGKILTQNARKNFEIERIKIDLKLSEIRN